MTLPKYVCTGAENPGNANIYEDGVYQTTIRSSRCHVEWYMHQLHEETGKTYTWDWRDGDPDYIPPEEES